MIHLESSKLDKIIENIESFNLPPNTTSLEFVGLFRGTWNKCSVFKEDDKDGNDLAIKLKLNSENIVYIDCTELIDIKDDKLNKFLKEIDEYSSLKRQETAL